MSAGWTCCGISIVAFNLVTGIQGIETYVQIEYKKKYLYTLHSNSQDFASSRRKELDITFWQHFSKLAYYMNIKFDTLIKACIFIYNMSLSNCFFNTLPP